MALKIHLIYYLQTFSAILINYIQNSGVLFGDHLIAQKIKILSLIKHAGSQLDEFILVGLAQVQTKFYVNTIHELMILLISASRN